MLCVSSGKPQRRKKIKKTQTNVAARLCPFVVRKGECPRYKCELRLAEQEYQRLSANAIAHNAGKAPNGALSQLQIHELKQTAATWAAASMRTRCTYRHSKVAVGDDIHTFVLREYFATPSIAVAEDLLLDDEGGEATEEDEEEVNEEGGIVPTDEGAPPKIVQVTIRNGTSINASFLAVLLREFVASRLSSLTAGIQDRFTGTLDERIRSAEAALNGLSDSVNLQEPAYLACFASALLSLGANAVASLSLRRNYIFDAIPLLNCLRSRGISLRALDLAYNGLHQHHFLFVLRSRFAELKHLCLAGNPISRKPDFNDFVRRSLPGLITLDGMMVRAPPLTLPYPTDFCSADPALYTRMLRHLCDFFVAVERHQLADDEEGFAEKWLHPFLSVSLTLSSDCVLWDPKNFRAENATIDDVDLPSDTASIVTAEEVRNLRAFAVGMESTSRNLLVGRPAVHRIATGTLRAMQCYQSSVYPQGLLVDHHFHHSVINVCSVLPDPPQPAQASASSKTPIPLVQTKTRSKRRRSEADDEAKAVPSANASPFGVKKLGAHYLVTLHGLMSWRTPSMQRERCIMLLCDRTMVFVDAPDDESTSLRLCNDVISLRPSSAGTEGPVLRVSAPVFEAKSEERCARVMEYHGLSPSDKSTRDIVQRLMEGSTSDAELFAMIQRAIQAETSVVGATPTSGASSGDSSSAAANMTTSMLGSTTLQHLSNETLSSILSEAASKRSQQKFPCT